MIIQASAFDEAQIQFYEGGWGPLLAWTHYESGVWVLYDEDDEPIARLATLDDVLDEVSDGGEHQIEFSD